MKPLLSVIDRTFLAAVLPTVGVVLVAIIRNGQLRLGPYLVWAFAAGVWGAWVIVAPQMLLAFFLGWLIGWLTMEWARRRLMDVRRAIAGALLRWANQLDPDRPWSRTP